MYPSTIQRIRNFKSTIVLSYIQHFAIFFSTKLWILFYINKCTFQISYVNYQPFLKCSYRYITLPTTSSYYCLIAQNMNIKMVMLPICFHKFCFNLLNNYFSDINIYMKLLQHFIISLSTFHYLIFNFFPQIDNHKFCASNILQI